MTTGRPTTVEPTGCRGGQRGAFITLEGGDGAGKSTQARLLAQWLESQGIATLCTREPGGTANAEALRALLLTPQTPDQAGWSPLSEALLHFTARREHLRTLVWPALKAGQWVICDRFTDSTLAYQGGGQGVPFAVLKRLDREITGAAVPDLTCLLDLDPAAGRARRDSRFATLAAEGAAERAAETAADGTADRAADQAADRAGEGTPTRYDQLADPFHQRVRQAFLDIAAAAPQRVVVLDGSEPVDRVSGQIRDQVQHRLLARHLARPEEPRPQWHRL